MKYQNLFAPAVPSTERPESPGPKVSTVPETSASNPDTESWTDGISSKKETSSSIVSSTTSLQKNKRNKKELSSSSIIGGVVAALLFIITLIVTATMAVVLAFVHHQRRNIKLENVKNGIPLSNRRNSKQGLLWDFD